MTIHTNLSAFHTSEAELSLKYQAVIQEIGSMTDDFLTYGILIFFGDTAPEELREVALVHNGTQLVTDLEAGNFLKFSPPSETQQSYWYRLTAIGEKANANLAELGHVVIHFDGATTASLPGAISAEPSLTALPTRGTTFAFFGLQEK
ncbi:MAG: PTS glucitol/sorbitol transporter subunit IIA [Chloroflexota bacterium]|nr:PTS glucitol/sorbitol transporter subunit IIA [Chloroflexota bacterium]